MKKIWIQYRCKYINKLWLPSKSYIFHQLTSGSACIDLIKQCCPSDGLFRPGKRKLNARLHFSFTSTCTCIQCIYMYIDILPLREGMFSLKSSIPSDMNISPEWQYTRPSVFQIWWLAESRDNPFLRASADFSATPNAFSSSACRLCWYRLNPRSCHSWAHSGNSFRALP